MIEELEIHPFVAAEASEEDWQQMTVFLNAIAEEELPEDPPYTVDYVRRDWLNVPPIMQRFAWLVRRQNGDVVAEAHVDFINMEENLHACQVRIAVLPELRQRGIGRRLLAKVAMETEAQNRRLMIGNTTSFAPSGERFMERIGAQNALAAVTNQLVVSQVPQGLLDLWALGGRERAKGYRLGYWNGPYPDDALPQIVRIKQAMNEAPVDDLEIEDIEWTPETVKQMDAMYMERGIERWTFYAEETATGDIAGYSEMMWSPNKPTLGQQGDTAVLRAHRNQGLGRWLKAEMLLKVMRDKPDTTLIRTGNANSNAPMLKINHELGFKAYKTGILWQIALPEVKAYLEAA